MFLCKDCTSNTWPDEYYMVHDVVWAAAGMSTEEQGMLCVGCLEKRLGRQLSPDDFTDAVINRMDFQMSARLRHRTGLGPDPMEPWKKISKI